ncbi:uncharacterized protein LOC133204874 [Saccostrea echinata]|uniref:uncharacterized protein LOC133204874 n=1 Tax=Saccostrea echinata TaxID=191078 RepID=UPI002A80F1D3|nr:uncharacterized protein LOC133204874 [Saccostrea echinata]
MKRSSEQSEHLYATKKARVVDAYGRSVESMDIEQDRILLVAKLTRLPPLTAVRGKLKRRNRPQPQPAPLEISSWVLKREFPYEKESKYSIKKTKHIDELGRCLEPVRCVKLSNFE